MNLIEKKEEAQEVVYSDALTLLLYDLMMYKLPAIDVINFVGAAVNNAERNFIKGPIAQQANELAEKIKQSKTLQFQKDLTKAFEESQEEVKQAEAKNKADLIATAAKPEEMLDDSLLDLENKLMEIASASKVTEDGDAKAPSTEESASTAKKVVEEMVKNGIMSEEEAKDINVDIDAVVEDVEEMVKKGVVSEEEAEDMMGDLDSEIGSASEKRIRKWEETKEKIESGEFEAEEIVKEVGEEDRLTPEEAQKMVEAVEEIYSDLRSNKVGVKETMEKYKNILSKSEKELKDIVSSTKVDIKTGEEVATGIVDAVSLEDVQKWKTTHEELVKQEEEKSMPEILVDVVKDSK